MKTLVLKFNKIENDDEIKYITFCSSSKAEIIIYDTHIDDKIESIYSTIISKIQKSLGNGSVKIWFSDRSYCSYFKK